MIGFICTKLTMNSKVSKPIEPKLPYICEECYGEELCERCSYIPKRALCGNCGLVRNHMFSPLDFIYPRLSIENTYYTCYWCGILLRNSRKNRREHGQKCLKKYSPIQVCNCKNICVACLKYTAVPKFYNGCGCTYCADCDIGYNTVQPYMKGYCQPCCHLGFKDYVQEAVTQYKKMCNVEKK
jgi:hypothetical protein